MTPLLRSTTPQTFRDKLSGSHTQPPMLAQRESRTANDCCHREAAKVWSCRVGTPTQPAPPDRVQSLFNDIELYPTKTQAVGFWYLGTRIRVRVTRHHTCHIRIGNPKVCLAPAPAPAISFYGGSILFMVHRSQDDY
ncbi:hypothetical protein EVAR_48180_1 [Eumeta japonica]|uniref:Uncharacterized protein n=1 Tax=Eumeta variegata TaxID=151549 RepID=A0A4C1XUQ3_EUMVA|nr:hypothetical protein EVAR_48180_1 [Eumeta japonica]